MYSNRVVSVFWKKHKCILSGNYIRKLPLVFSPTQHPWVNMMYAGINEIIATIDLCPSGALTYTLINEKI